jgi:RNA polymerase primary sigma factor
MKQLVITNRRTNREIHSFNQYLKDIAEIEVFTPQEEAICAEKASHGDKQAVDELVRRNLRFVVSVAKQYATAQNPLEDLVNEGNIGLIIAAKKFKPEMGFKFISYAVWWVRKIIMEHLSKHGRLVRLPANKINSLSKLDKQINQLEQKLGRNVSIHEIIEEFGSEFGLSNKQTPKKISDEYILLDMLNDFTMDSLDRDISGDEGNGTTLAETISDDSIFKSADNGLLNEDIKKQLNEVLDTLKPRDRQVMVGLFGLDGNLPRTLNDIGDEIGVTREMVRQIRQKSLGLLKKKLETTNINK